MTREWEVGFDFRCNSGLVSASARDGVPKGDGKVSGENGRGESAEYDRGGEAGGGGKWWW